MITRAHQMVDRLKSELGSLDHLCFAFPQVLGDAFKSWDDPSTYVAGAIARARKPPIGTVKSIVGPGHPLPSSYVRLDGIVGVELIVPTNAAKKLLKRKNCLVIERWERGWGDEFVCRVPNWIRDGIDERTIAIVGIPPDGYDWNVRVVSKLQEVSRSISAQRASTP